MRLTIPSFLIAAAAAVALSACAPPRKTEIEPDLYAATVQPDCYTVDLFTATDVIEPADDVPLAWRGFLGAWGGGAWEGRWCHDLYVLSVAANGDVEVISTHAPFPEWKREATAFRRKGRIGDDGALRLRYKNVVEEYRLKGDRLYGLRREGASEMHIKLAPKV